MLERSCSGSQRGCGDVGDEKKIISLVFQGIVFDSYRGNNNKLIKTHNKMPFQSARDYLMATKVNYYLTLCMEGWPSC